MWLIWLDRACGAQTRENRPHLAYAEALGCGIVTADSIGESAGMRQRAERISLCIGVFEREADFERRLIDDHAVIDAPAQLLDLEPVDMA